MQSFVNSVIYLHVNYNYSYYLCYNFICRVETKGTHGNAEGVGLTQTCGVTGRRRVLLGGGLLSVRLESTGGRERTGGKTAAGRTPVQTHCPGRPALLWTVRAASLYPEHSIPKSDVSPASTVRLTIAADGDST